MFHLILGPEVNEECFDDRIQMQILFSFQKNTEYEYDYSVSQKWMKTNMNIIWFCKIDRLQILFSYPEMTEYKYKYDSASQ